MKQNSVDAALRAVVRETLGLDDSQLATARQGLLSVAALDSVALLELVVAIEKRFGVALGEEWLEVDRLANLEELAAYIEQSMENRPDA